jgi:hypothetical protein
LQQVGQRLAKPVIVFKYDYPYCQYTKLKLLPKIAPPPLGLDTLANYLATGSLISIDVPLSMAD